MRFAFVSGNRVSRFVSMNKLAKALAILRPEGDFTKYDFLASGIPLPEVISDSDFENLRKMHFVARVSLDNAYDN